MPNKKISIAIPASIISDVPHLREKTSKIGFIGRTAAIFQVDEIIIYSDKPMKNQKVDMNFIADILRYMETPQYLRKHLFKIKKEMKYVGILPPMRTPHHPLNRKKKRLELGEYREGLVLGKTGKHTLIDIGVEQPALTTNSELQIGKQVTVKIVKIKERIEIIPSSRKEVNKYWGYNVYIEKNLKNILKKDFNLKIITSKRGIPFYKVVKELAQKWENSNSILIAFGAPKHGLFEIADKEKIDLNTYSDLIINTIPNQGTVTIRTEEAIISSLAILSFTNLVEFNR